MSDVTPSGSRDEGKLPGDPPANVQLQKDPSGKDQSGTEDPVVVIAEESRSVEVLGFMVCEADSSVALLRKFGFQFYADQYEMSRRL